MTKLKALLIGASAIVLLSDPVSVAVAQSALSIGDNDSVFVDGTTFTIVPGKGKGDTSALVRKLDARALWPGVIIFRSGDKLYIADARPLEGVRLYDRRGSDRYSDYGSDRRGSDRYSDYGSDRRGSDRYSDYGSDRRGSDRYSDYGSDRRGSDRYSDYGSDRRGSDRYSDYGSDRNSDNGADRSGNGRNRVVIDDPDYAQYKIKKIFQDNWTPAAGVPTAGSK